MTALKIHKSDIAKNQLETSVKLFLSGRDRSSVITLAGAATGILETLVSNSGKEPFVDYARKVHRELAGQTPKRQVYAHHISKKTGVIAHKHMSKGDPETVELDLEKMACDALIRALADYATLNGQDEPFVKAFYQWAWENLDGKALLDEYIKLPKKMKPE